MFFTGKGIYDVSRRNNTRCGWNYEHNTNCSHSGWTERGFRVNAECHQHHPANAIWLPHFCAFNISRPSYHRSSHIERENDRPEDVPPCCGGKCRFQMRDLLARLTVIKCDQTTVWAIPKIVCREEVRRSLPGRVRFVLRGRLQHGNNLDCSTGAFSARRRGLGIFAVASLKWLLNKHGTRAV